MAARPHSKSSWRRVWNAAGSCWLSWWRRRTAFRPALPACVKVSKSTSPGSQYGVLVRSRGCFLHRATPAGWVVWWVSPPSIEIVVPNSANAGSLVGGLVCAAPCIWQLFQLQNTIRSFEPFTSHCSSAEKRRKSLSQLVCASYWSLSMPWSEKEKLGKCHQPDLTLIPLTFITVAARSVLCD